MIIVISPYPLIFGVVVPTTALPGVAVPVFLFCSACLRPPPPNMRAGLWVIGAGDLAAES